MNDGCHCHGRRPRARGRLLATVAGIVLAHATASRAVTLADPVTYTVKRTWSAATLSIPTSLAGIRFAPDGNTLYAVGSADVPASAMYAIPVVRDPTTHEIVDLAMAAATPVFSANVSTAAGGLDSGPATGPAGTLFYTYFDANNGNFIGERRPSDIGTETQYDVAPLGVPLWLGGLAFSIFRTDPGTSFGRLNVSVYTGDPDTTPRDVYEIGLTPQGNGFFAPGSATRLLSLDAGTVNGLCYVPVAPFFGSLMYTSFDAGEVRYIDIDPATGLAIDKASGQPMLGTTAAVDHPFAADLSVGPVGVDFDPLTTDLFISTYEGAPANSIMQIGGFTAAPPTTTTTTVVVASTTTSTLPSACAPGATFDSIGCRIEELALAVQSLSGVDAVQTKLARKLAAAKAKIQAAASRAQAGKKGGAKALIGKTNRLMRGFRTILSTRKAQAIATSTRAQLANESSGILTDLATLKHGI